LVQGLLRLYTLELDIFLPLAVSFFTFQKVMFLAESESGDRIDAGLLPYAAFVAFFQRLIAGPIVRSPGCRSAQAEWARQSQCCAACWDARRRANAELSGGHGLPGCRLDDRAGVPGGA
jgi:hypothetical protein